MSDTNPEIEASLDEIAKLVCESLKGDSDELGERDTGLLRTLLMSGFVGKSEQTLMVEVEDRVKALCGKCAMHRGGALSSITAKLGQKLQSMSRMEANVPNDDSPPKTANISSATDA